MDVWIDLEDLSINAKQIHSTFNAVIVAIQTSGNKPETYYPALIMLEDIIYKHYLKLNELFERELKDSRDRKAKSQI